MEKPVNNIKDPKIRSYFEDITEKRQPTVDLTADEYEEGVRQFNEGLDKVLAEADEMIARHKIGSITEAVSLSYIAKTYFGKSRGWLMQKVNGNMVNGKRASFTPSESQRMREALQDLSDKLSKAALAF